MIAPIAKKKKPHQNPENTQAPDAQAPQAPSSVLHSKERAHITELLPHLESSSGFA